MDFDVEICQLSEEFYKAYPEELYPEIMIKDNRPYTCLLIETHDDYLICIPFRSHILHKNAFFFSESSRSKRTPSGLDYKKSVIIKDKTYIDNTNTVVVDGDEYNETIINIEKIVSEVHAYIQDYILHVKGTNVLHHREFLRRYEFSTLPYFHDILELPN